MTIQATVPNAAVEELKITNVLSLIKHRGDGVINGCARNRVE